MKWSIRDIVIASIFSYIVVTIINYLAHEAFPSIPIFKSGIALVLLLISVILVMFFSFVSDGRFTMDEVKALLIIVLLMIGFYLVIRFALPDLFSIIPESTKQLFSSIVP